MNISGDHSSTLSSRLLAAALLTGLAAFVSGLTACAGPGAGDCPTGPRAAVDLVATDLEGRPCGLFDDPNAKAIVLIFVLPDCPISNVYTREYERLHADYADRGVDLHLVYADDELTPEEAHRHRKDYELTMPALIDAEYELARFAGATVTPEAAVFGPDGQILYRGRIDDLYVDFGKRRERASQLDLRDALDAILAGDDPDPARTTPVGCFIPLPDGVASR